MYKVKPEINLDHVQNIMSQYYPQYLLYAFFSSLELPFASLSFGYCKSFR
jgi:hypothetical protein